MREVDLVDSSVRGDARFKVPRILLLVTEGTKGDWGELEPLRGTSWEAGVELVDAESFSHALHGHVLPLLRALGRDPSASGKRVSEAEGSCAMRGSCASWVADRCRPGGKGNPPACYEPPLSPGSGSSVTQLFRTVAAAWAEGRHTVVVVGEGFNLR